MGRIRPVPHKVSWSLKIITFDLTTDPFFYSLTLQADRNLWSQ